MPLELQSLKKAIDSLTQGWGVYSSAITKTRSTTEQALLRAGVIQNFEFTYELCWKFMKRWLENNVNSTVDGVTRRELFRLAAENRLIKTSTSGCDFIKAATRHPTPTITTPRKKCVRLLAISYLRPNRCIPSWKSTMIDLSPLHRQMVEAILSRCIPDYEVKVFGSRAKGTAKSYSDLDLVVVGAAKLPTPVLYGLRDAFEESELPFRVEIVDWNRLTPEFKHAILSHSESLAARAV